MITTARVTIRNSILQQHVEWQAVWIRMRLCSTSSDAGRKETPPPSSSEGVSVQYTRGLPQLIVPLPSRKERCLFSLRPITHNVGDLMQQIQSEDRGIDRVALKTLDGTRIAASNSIESLMEQDFDLVINDVVYRVVTPQRERISREEMERLSDVQNLVMQLYEGLHVGEHQLKKERQLLTQLEELQSRLAPLEEKKKAVVAAAERRTTVLTWAGLTLMGVQFGALARLTWWEYSWDIMEPITYFVTYGTSIAAFAYYVLTKQEYVLPDVRDREFLLHFHKKAKKYGMNVDEYNRLKDSMAQLERDLQRLRDPLRVQNPSSPNGGDLPSLTDQPIAASLWNRTQYRLQKLIRQAQSNKS